MAKENNKRYQDVHIPIENHQFLSGNLYIPENPIGLVIFAHGSGSSRLSPRNRYVAEKLNQDHLATFLFDLLTSEEEIIDNRISNFRFDIPLLAERLVIATHWIRTHPALKDLKIGYFGASTGAGASLIAAAELPTEISAIVSRGGRPDLAQDYLLQVTCPTLLIVGGLDHTVIALNQQAQAKIKAVTELAIVKGATHLFEEPGTLEEVTHLASEWFKKNFQKHASI